MRILFLNHNLCGQGTWFRAFDMAREMTRRGHDCTLITASKDHWYRRVEETVGGVHVIEMPSWNPLVSRDDGWGPLDTFLRLLHVVRRRYDLVYAFAHPPNVYLPARLAQMLGTPLVADWCDPYVEGIFPLREEVRAYRRETGWRVAMQRLSEKVESPLERRVLRKADRVTVISRYLEEAALECNPNVLRIPGGANIDLFRPLDKDTCRAHLAGQCGIRKLLDSGPLLGYIANYNPDERLLLDTLRRVCERHPEARLVTTAPEFTSKLVEETGTRGQIITLGRRPHAELPTVLGACDILLLPMSESIFNRGRWPNKIGDYLASGRPVATCAVGDIVDFVPGPGAPCGVATPPEPDAWAPEICALLDNPKRCEEMGKAARKTAEEHLAWPVLGEKLEAFLTS